MTCGIYKITNLKNNKIYVGQSIDIEQRYANHLGQAFTKNPSRNWLSLIDRAIKKYGKNNFQLKILEECAPEDLNQKEQYWIQKLECLVPNGYNISLGGDSGLKYNNDLIISTFYENYGYIQKTANQIGCSTEVVRRVLKNNNLNPQVIKSNLEAYKYKTKCTRKKVAQIDKDTKQILEIYPSASSAARALQIKNGNIAISAVCRGDRKSAYGYVWQYLEGDE